MKTTARSLAIPLPLSVLLLLGVVETVRADSLPGCLMSISAPGACLTESVNCAGTPGALAAAYGSSIAALCETTGQQTISAQQAESHLARCQQEKNAQADFFGAQLTSESALKIDAVKALSRANQKIRSLQRSLRQARR